MDLRRLGEGDMGSVSTLDIRVLFIVFAPSSGRARERVTIT
jgi:hypothetical protein